MLPSFFAPQLHPLLSFRFIHLPAAGKIAAACVIALALTMGFSSTASAAIKTETVEYQQGGITFRGQLAYDDSISGKRPAVLVFPEWWGNNDYTKGRAEQLAMLGYVALAADLYGNGATADDPEGAGALAGPLLENRKLLRERATAALEALKKNEHVDPAKVVAIGYCFGGTAALELARSGADIAGVVTFHGGLSTPTPADAKNIKGKILVCAGGDDPFVPADQRVAFEKEMRDAGVDWQLNVYGGAVHAFTNPKAGEHHMKGVDYNASADHRSWEAMKAFFDEILK